MKNVFLYTYGLLYLIVAVFAVMLAILIYQITGISLFILIPVALVISAPIAFIIFKILMLREKNDPMAKLHSEFMKELTTNGVTEKMLSMADQAINEHINVKPVDIVYFKDFVVLPADHFNMIGDFERAKQYLQLIDEDEIRSKSIKFIDNGFSLLTYFIVKIYTLYNLKDQAGVKRIYDEAKGLFEKPDKNEFQTMVLDCLEFYYMLSVYEYDKAKVVSDRLMSYRGSFADSLMTKYAVSAELYLLLGDREKATEIMRECIEKANSVNPVLKLEFERLVNRWGLEL